MAIDKFDIVRFEDALPAGCWTYGGMEDGERVYIVKPTGAPGGFGIRVRSSIGPSGVADEAGEDSIRAVICDSNRQPYGGKNVRWVSRVNGWERRLGETLAVLRTQVLRLTPCAGCGIAPVPFTAQTDKNKGRPFVTCKTKGCKAPVWQFTDRDAPAAAVVNPDAPTCPKCQSAGKASPMVRMGSGKGWRCGIQGNRWMRGGWTVCDGVIWDKCLKVAPVDVPSAADCEADDAPPSMPATVSAQPVPVRGAPAFVPPAQPMPATPTATAFPADGARPVRVRRIDPEAGRFLALVKDAAGLLDGGVVDDSPALREALAALPGIKELAALLAK